jgi:hypothetical protein
MTRQPDRVHTERPFALAYPTASTMPSGDHSKQPTLPTISGVYPHSDKDKVTVCCQAAGDKSECKVEGETIVALRCKVEGVVFDGVPWKEYRVTWPFARPIARLVPPG